MQIIYKKKLQRACPDSVRGRDWHYSDWMTLNGEMPERKNKIPVPEELKTILRGYSKLCSIYHTKRGHYICAVPEKGGDYLILVKAQIYDLENMKNTEGLVNLVKKAETAATNFILGSRTN